MISKAKTPEEYLAEVPAERAEFFKKLRDVVNANLPPGFEEGMGYGMLGWAVPKTLYPPGYHCDPKVPLPFAGLASQKNSINFYHMAVVEEGPLREWFQTEWPKRTKMKLDMGKSCIRMAKFEQIPFELFGELMGKLTVEDWVAQYEARKDSR